MDRDNLGELFEGVEEFLSILKKEKKKTFILSNVQSSYTLYEIQGFSLDKMVDDYIMFGDSYQNDYFGAKEYEISGLWLNGEDYSDKIYK